MLWLAEYWDFLLFRCYCMDLLHRLLREILAAINLLVYQTGFIRPGTVAHRQALGSSLAAWCASPVSGASQVSSKPQSAVTVPFPAPQHCERNLGPKTWCSVTAACSCTQMTMTFNRLSLTLRGVSVLAQTDSAVQQILAAALLLREVIWVGYMLAFSLKCHLWGVIFYFS